VTDDSQENPLTKYACAVAAVFFGAAVCFGATGPVGSTRPATSAATAPALSREEIKERETAARAVLKDFFTAMFAGDTKGALALLAYTELDEAGKPKSKEKAEVMLGEVLAEQRLRKAVTAAFGEVAFKLGRSDADVAAFQKDFEAAAPKVAPDGSLAMVAMPRGIAYVVIWKEGKWQVDFDKTQLGIGPLPKAEEMGPLPKLTEGYDQLAKEVAAKKFGTVAEVTKEADRIAAAAARAAETAPGTGTRP
jgi:hypothetical protein